MSREMPTVGDVVKWWPRGAIIAAYGKVETITAAGTIQVRTMNDQGVLVDSDNRVQFRKPKYGAYTCEVATTHEIATLAWKASQPRTRFVEVDWGWRRGNEPTVQLRNPLKESEHVVEAGREMELLAAWLARKP